jgi:beta-glucosidase
LAYVKKTVEALKSKVNYWLVFNEPLVYTYKGYLEAAWPPGRNSLNETLTVVSNMINAYYAAYEEIKNIYKKSGLAAPKISFAKHMRVFSPCPKAGRIGKFFAHFRDRNFNWPLFKPLVKNGCIDFIAVNYYCREYVGGGSLFGKECLRDHHIERKNFLGWNVYPDGLYELLAKLKHFGLPIIITENGTAEKYNDVYYYFLVSHLKQVARAIEAGIDVRGYYWWSLMDNFEWDKGFAPRFGLCEINYKTFERKLRPFAFDYGKICKEGILRV